MEDAGAQDGQKMCTIVAPAHAGPVHAVGTKAVTGTLSDATGHLIVLINEVQLIGVGRMAGELGGRPCDVNGKGTVWGSASGRLAESHADLPRLPLRALLHNQQNHLFADSE
jgi:hypothetical protein